jgi:hypothetical protein
VPQGGRCENSALKLMAPVLHRLVEPFVPNLV